MKNKFIALILAVAIVFSAFPPQARAEYWLSNYANAFLNQMLQNIYAIVMDAIMVALKKEAINMVKEEITGSVVGDDVGFITDWQDEMFTKSEDAAKTYVNDFLSTTTRGKCSASDYTSGTGGSGGSGDYLSYMCSQARSMAFGPSESDSGSGDDSSVNIDEYMTNPEQMFDSGNWTAFSAFFQGNNNPTDLGLTIQKEMIKKVSQEEEKAKTKAIAFSGFKGSEENGMTITPGSISKDVLAKSESLQLDELANAQKWQEIIGEMIASAITRTIKDGIGDVKEKIQSEVNSTVGQYRRQMEGVDRYR